MSLTPEEDILWCLINCSAGSTRLRYLKSVLSLTHEEEDLLANTNFLSSFNKTLATLGKISALSIHDCHKLFDKCMQPSKFHLICSSNWTTSNHCQRLYSILESQLPSAKFANALVYQIVVSQPREANFQPVGGETFLALHGTGLENIFSIMSQGLMLLTSTTSFSSQLKPGGIFGDGVYLSTSLEVARHFSKQGRSWSYGLWNKDTHPYLSTLGDDLLCVCVFEVARHHASVTFGQNKKDQGLPEEYVLINACDVENSSAFLPRYLMVFPNYKRRSSSPQQCFKNKLLLTCRRYFFAIIIILYIFILLASRYFKR